MLTIKHINFISSVPYLGLKCHLPMLQSPVCLPPPYPWGRGPKQNLHSRWKCEPTVYFLSQSQLNSTQSCVDVKMTLHTPHRKPNASNIVDVTDPRGNLLRIIPPPKKGKFFKFYYYATIKVSYIIVSVSGLKIQEACFYLLGQL